MAIPGTVTVTGIIAPTTESDTYPVTDTIYGLDGLRNVTTRTQRNAIPNLRRRAGMVVGVSGVSSTEYWSLKPAPWTGTDSDWVEFNYSLKYYAENTVLPSISPIASGSGSIALGDGAKALSGDMFVYGTNAGNDATNAAYSNFLGNNAGYQATGASGSNFMGYNAGYQAKTASQSNFIGLNAGYKANNANNSNFFGAGAGSEANQAQNSNFLGQGAGYQATGASESNFLGGGAGSMAKNANQSNFLGPGSGAQATNANNSNFFNVYAGAYATGASNSNFMGYQAGLSAKNANNSNFMGYQAGLSAKNANNSNFMGYSAGYLATNAAYSNFLGNNAGYQATGASYSTLIGYNAGYSNTLLNSIGSNNIIIGTNISLSAGTTGSINIGGVLFGKGTYSTTIGSPSIVPSTNGRIGIGVVDPLNTLHVSATTNPVRFEGLDLAVTNTAGVQVGDSRIMTSNNSGVLGYFSSTSNAIPYFNASNAITTFTGFTFSFNSGTRMATLTFPNSNALGSGGSVIQLNGGRCAITSYGIYGLNFELAYGQTGVPDTTKKFTFQNKNNVYLTMESDYIYNTYDYATFGSAIHVSTGNVIKDFWGTSGIATRVLSATYSDASSSVSAGDMVANSFAAPTFSAANGTTYAGLSTVYIAGAPTAGANVSGNTYALKVKSGNVLIGSSTNDTSAILNVESTSKGFLPPRMTGAQAELISSPSEGLMVYATSAGSGAITSKGWWGYDGSTWVKLN